MDALYLSWLMERWWGSKKVFAGGWPKLWVGDLVNTLRSSFKSSSIGSLDDSSDDSLSDSNDSSVDSLAMPTYTHCRADEG